MTGEPTSKLTERLRGRAARSRQAIEMLSPGPLKSATVADAELDEEAAAALEQAEKALSFYANKRAYTFELLTDSGQRAREALAVLAGDGEGRVMADRSAIDPIVRVLLVDVHDFLREILGEHDHDPHGEEAWHLEDGQNCHTCREIILLERLNEALNG